jgi:hypothetical protein
MSSGANGIPSPISKIMLASVLLFSYVFSQQRQKICKPVKREATRENNSWLFLQQIFMQVQSDI